MTTTDPEAAFVGALLLSPAGRARQLLALVEAADLRDPRAAVVHELVAQVVENGVDPDPVAVLAHARAHGTCTSAEAVRGLSLLLLELHAGCPSPTSAPVYAAAVLEDAVRRRCTELSTRVGQAVEQESLGSLVALVDRESQAVRALVARRQAMTSPAPRLRAVSA